MEHEDRLFFPSHSSLLAPVPRGRVSATLPISMSDSGQIVTEELFKREEVLVCPAVECWFRFIYKTKKKILLDLVVWFIHLSRIGIISVTLIK